MGSLFLILNLNYVVDSFLILTIFYSIKLNSIRQQARPIIKINKISSSSTDFTEADQNRKGVENVKTDYQPLTKYISGMPKMFKILQ